MHDYISLDRIFHLQDEVLNRIRHVHSKRYEFAKECVERAINLAMTEDRLSDDLKNKFRVVQVYQSDALSALINSLKLCLFGCITDSLALLRLAVEELAVLSYLVNSNSYKTATYYIRHRSKQLKFETIVKKIPDGKAIEQLHGRLSNIACHATSKRLRKSYFKIRSELFPRIGVAYDPEGSGQALGEIDRAALYLLRLIMAFNTQHAISSTRDIANIVNEMELKFEALKA